MTAARALKMQIDLANTAHQREVADLQAAGLNPILSANGSGAAVPNISGFATSSGSKTSARAAIKLAKLDPTAKAIDTANNAVNQIADVARKIGKEEYVREVHPEYITSANKAVEENQRKIAEQIAANAASSTQNSQGNPVNSANVANELNANEQAAIYSLIGKMFGMRSNISGNQVSAFKKLLAKRGITWKDVPGHFLDPTGIWRRLFNAVRNSVEYDLNHD